MGVVSAVLLLQVLTVGPGTTPTIGAALDRARAGDTVRVSAGVYHEHGLRVGRGITLLGPGAAGGEAILDGDGEAILVVVDSGVTVRHLVFRNVATSFVDDRAALLLETATDCRIESNVFRDTFFGLYAARAERCHITGNRFDGPRRSQTQSGNAIHLWNSRHMTVEGNRATGHRDGIYLEFARHSTVDRNESAENIRYGLHFMFSDSSSYTGNHLRDNGAGVAVMYTRSVVMVDNRFEHNWGAASYGLLLKDITDARIEDNVFLSNSVGIVAEGSNRLRVTGNTFQRNGSAIRVLANATDGQFRRNTFLGNTFDVVSNGRATPSVFEENYWDGYRGYDLDRNGIGDVPFRPVRLSAVLVAEHAPATILLRSFFLDLLDAAERVLPILTPLTLVDERPLMRQPGA